MSVENKEDSMNHNSIDSMDCSHTFKNADRFETLSMKQNGFDDPFISNNENAILTLQLKDSIINNLSADSRNNLD